MDYKLKRLYKFNTIAPTVLGNAYNNMQLTGILTYEEASTYTDILSMHNSIRSVISNTTLPVNASSCTFLKFLSQDKNVSIFAMEYLLNVEEVTTQKLIITVNNYTSSDYTIIRDTLLKYGYDNISFEVVSN